MTDVHIRIYFREVTGTLVDSQQEFDVGSFAGLVPGVGDMIVNPGVPQGPDRHNPSNRQVWDVVGRVFNPRDMDNYVALIVEERAPNPSEFGVVAG